MFGILKPALPSQEKQDQIAYQQEYCGLCGCLGEHFGLRHRMILVNDVVTLLWLFQREEATRQRFCRANCLRGGTFAPQTSGATTREQFAAALSVLLYGIKVRDDQQDGTAGWSRLTDWIPNNQLDNARAVLKNLGFPVVALDASLADQVALENNNEADFHNASDPTARCYGQVCQNLVQFGDSSCSEYLAREIGSRLGRLVYLIDAFQDREADVGNSYNPLLCEKQRRITSISPMRMREFDLYVHGVFTELDTLCSEGGAMLSRRWAAIRSSLQSLIRRDPASVTLNMICCIPCGNGAGVAVDSKECDKFMTGCAICCCLICLSRR